MKAKICNASGEGFRKIDFEYDFDSDTYMCPVGEELTTNGTVFDKHGKNGQLQTRFRVYRLPSFAPVLQIP